MLGIPAGVLHPLHTCPQVMVLLVVWGLRVGTGTGPMRSRGCGDLTTRLLCLLCSGHNRALLALFTRLEAKFRSIYKVLPGAHH